MSHHTPPPFLIIIIIFPLLSTLHVHALPVLPNPDPDSVQPFHPDPSQPVIIPSFPEQSALAGCPVHLPAELFPAVKASCSPLSRSKCCPVLAAWLYSAYSDTALGAGSWNSNNNTTTSFEMPLLPDDSETCVDGLENAMRENGVNLVKPNETCDVIYCYCGIRLHPLSCSQAFRVSETGELVGDGRVSKLERDCVSDATPNRLARCSKCLDSLYSLKKSGSGSGNGNATGSKGRTQKMRGRDCDLMGLTWLLNKDRDTYMSTVTEVMRALTLNSDTSDPLSCTLNSDGMPLAVDSAQIDEQSSSLALLLSPYIYVSSFVSLIMYLSYFV
ncbi:hypothetical protein vseg_013206 [Gypsophila vaccaria]